MSCLADIYRRVCSSHVRYFVSFCISHRSIAGVVCGTTYSGVTVQESNRLLGVAVIVINVSCFTGRDSVVVDRRSISACRVGIFIQQDCDFVLAAQRIINRRESRDRYAFADFVIAACNSLLRAVPKSNRCRNDICAVHVYAGRDVFGNAVSGCISRYIGQIGYFSVGIGGC